MESHDTDRFVIWEVPFQKIFYDRKTHEMMCQGQKSVVKKGGVSITHWTNVQKITP